MERGHDVVMQIGGNAAGIIPVFPETEETVRVERPLRRVAEPLLPVDMTVARGVGPGARIDGPVPVSLWIVPAVGALHRDHFSDGPGLDDVADFVPSRPGKRLHTNLHDALLLLRRGGNLRGLFGGVRHGLFAVDVDTAIERQKCNRGVPMVGSGDEDGVNILALQQFLVVCVLLGFGRLLARPRQAFLVDVAQGDYNRVIFFRGAMQRHLEEIRAPRAEPDDRGIDPVVRSQNAAAGRECGGDARCSLDEIAPSDSARHIESLLTYASDCRKRLLSQYCTRRDRLTAAGSFTIYRP